MELLAFSMLFPVPTLSINPRRDTKNNSEIAKATFTKSNDVSFLLSRFPETILKS
jgi:hypothetical protein